jgi:hypothetical protein
MASRKALTPATILFASGNRIGVAKLKEGTDRRKLIMISARIALFESIATSFSPIM